METKEKPGKKVNKKDVVTLPKGKQAPPRKGTYRTKSGMWVNEEKFRTPFKSGGKLKKAKSGGKFPDLNKDGKTTFKDVLIGRGVLPKKAKSGTKVKKAMMGAMASPMMAKPMMKKGGSMKKCKYGCK